MKTNKMHITKGNNLGIYFSEDLKLSAEQRAWLHNHGIRKDKWEDNKYFLSLERFKTSEELKYLFKLIGVLYFRVLKIGEDNFEKSYSKWSEFCYIVAQKIADLNDDAEMWGDAWIVYKFLQVRQWKA